MAPPGVKRPPTVDDRDVRKPYTPARGTALAIPHEVCDPVTGVLQGEDLRKARNKRRTEERLDRVEDKQDKHGERLIKVEAGVEQLVAWKIEEREEKRLDRQFRAQTETNQFGLERVRLNSRAKIIVALFGLLAAAIGVLGTLLAKGAL